MAIIDKRFLYYTTEAGFLKDKKDGKIDSKSIVFLSENGKRAVYTHGKFFNPDAFVVGTQSSPTNVFTGVFNEIDSLYDGLNIRYWLPYDGNTSAATLNLTIGDTTTGAIPVYIKGTTRFTNHIGGTNVLDLTYRENVGGIEKGWWVLGSYGDAADGNTTYTFTSGEAGTFKVKPSNGSEQEISVGKPETAGTADKVKKKFTVQVNSGLEEDISLYEYDGSSAKTLNIVQGSNINFGVEDGELTINGNYKTATTSEAGLMSGSDKSKLDGISENAEVNQNAFSNIKIGETVIAADTKTDTLNIIAGNNITITPNEDSIKIDSSYTNTDEKVKITTGSTTKSYLVGVNSTDYTSGNATDNLITDTDVYLDTEAGKISAKEFSADTLSGNLKGTIDSSTVAQTAESGDKSKKVATTEFVDTAISTSLGDLSGALVFKGILNSPSDLPITHEVGWTYRIGIEGTYAGQECEVGDMIICITQGTESSDSHWTIAQNNIDGAVVNSAGSVSGNFAVFEGTTGKIIKDSGKSASDFTYTAGAGLSLSNNKFSIDSDLLEGTYGPEANVNGTNGTTVVIPQIKVDENGLISEISEFTYTSKDTNTHYTTGLYVGASEDKSNAATENGSTYIKLYDDDTSRASFKITGSGSTTVKSDASGNITINSTTYTLSGALDDDTDTFKSTLTSNNGSESTSIVPVFSGATSSAGGKAGLVPSPDLNEANLFLKADGTWSNPYTHPTYTARTGKPTEDEAPGFGETFTVSQITSNTLGHVTGVTDRTITIPSSVATTSTPGLMSAVDKTKLGGIEEGANNYILPEATDSNLGGIKIAKDNAYTVTTATSNISADVTAVGKYYGVELDSTGKAFVYVPWTKYTAMTALEATNGIATTARSITAKVLNDKITEMLPDVMSGATSSAPGTSGLVPAPAAGDQDKFLRADGTWMVPTTYSGDRGISLVSGKFGHSNTKITEKTAFVDTDEDASISVSSNNGSFKVTDIKYDAYGHITGSQDRTITLSEHYKGTVTSVTIEGDTGISVTDNTGIPVDDSDAITSSGTRKISLNTATTDAIGGMMASNALTTEVTLTSGNGSTANRYYGVQVDKNGKAFVNIPWTDGNTYTSAYSSTAAGTAAKTASCTNYTLKDNSWLHVTIVNSNTSQRAITLNVNGKGAKPIYINGIASSSSNYTLPAGTYLVYYDGTAYQFNTNGILPGTSSKASTLATPRTLKIGNTGKAFDGSADVSWSLEDIGAAASSHNHAYTDLTGSGTTANQAIVSSGTADGWTLYTLGAAAGKGTTTSVTSGSTALVTSGGVYTAINNAFAANDAMLFKGTLGTNSGDTVSALPSTTAKTGWTYRVTTAGTYDSKVCEIGDLIICLTDGSSSTAAKWTVAQTNIDGAVIGPTSSEDGHIVVFDRTSGKLIKSSGKTIANLTYSSGTGLSLSNNTFSLATSGVTKGTYGPLAAVTGSEGSTISVPQITVDEYGRVTGIVNKTYTSKNTTYTAETGLSLSNNSFSLATVTNLTAGDYGNTSQQTPSHGGTFNIPYYTVDDYGRITKAGTTTVKLPGSGNTDTKVNVTLATTSKAYLIGVTSTPTSTATAMTAVSDTGVYLDTTAGTLTATAFNGNASSATYTSNIRVTATTSADTYYPMWTTGTNAGTNYVLRGNSNFRYNIVAGTTSAQGYDSIYLGNSTASGTAGNSAGRILLYSSSTSYHYLIGAATTSPVTHTLPATTGTVLNTGTTGITAVQTSGAHIATLKINGTDTKLYAPSNPSLSLGTTATTTTAETLVSSVEVSGHTVTMTKYNGTIGSTTKPAYFSSGVPTVCSTYAGGTAVTLNGTSKAASTASFYAPTAAGTSGQVLVSSGGAPGWKDFDEIGLKTGTVTKAITTDWADLISSDNMATYCPEAGTYVIQVYSSTIGYNSGVFSWKSAGAGDEEILLHRSGASTNIYLKIKTGALQIAGAAAVSSGSISVKVKRLI